mmetsp:Transcript_14030/g.16538  ORF Transcript_14030/g.16538 Transcript_14030/m.16538 type:complete len:391 (-) Transcript_14030:224-1396(-)
MATLATKVIYRPIKCLRKGPLVIFQRTNSGISKDTSSFDIRSPLSFAQGQSKFRNGMLTSNGTRRKLQTYYDMPSVPFNRTNLQRSHYSTYAKVLSPRDKSPRSAHSNRTTRHTSHTTTTTTPTTTTADKNFASDLIVVLDMDECLIHSEFLQNSANDYRQYEADRLAHSQASANDDEPKESLLTASTCESFRISLADGDLVHVNKRPHLDFFLKKITERYETYIFTAAMEVYASPVLNTLDPKGGMFQHRFYREHCTFDEPLGVYVKDLRNAFNHTMPHSDEDMDGALNEEHMKENGKRVIPAGVEKPFNGKRTVLVDNNPYSFLANPSNGILVSNFYDDPKDDTLRSVINLLSELESVDDVRPVLDSKFGLKEALKQIPGGKGYSKRY